jgi:hypothetical protein
MTTFDTDLKCRARYQGIASCRIAAFERYQVTSDATYMLVNLRYDGLGDLARRTRATKVRSQRPLTG